MSETTRTQGPESLDPAHLADAADASRTRTIPPPADADGVTRTHSGEPPVELPIDLPGAPPGFEIIPPLGSGGMGVVYEAQQARLNRRVALKVLAADRGEAKDAVRFLTEAEALAAVRHPHVVQVYEFGQDSGRPFIVLELLTGGTLADRLRAGPLEHPRAAELVAKLAEAVRAMHELGIVHRDLKPGNVLFDQEGKPKIADFGLAKRTGGTDLTRTQAVMGTPAYMAPEQARGEAKFVGPAADIHALGVILFESLTGKRPFEGEDSWSVLRKVMESPPPGLREQVSGLPRDLELIALKCLEKDPADRYPSAAGLAADLENFLAGRPVSMRPAGRMERLIKWSRRNPAVSGLLAALLVVAAFGFAGVTAGFMRAEARGRDLARTNNELTRTNDDLSQSRNDLRDSMKAAEAAREVAESRGYLSDVALAHQLFKANDLAGMRAALTRCPLQRRNWEWHYLDGLTRRSRAPLQTDSMSLALAYSPDGKWVASLTVSGTLVTQDRATGNSVTRLRAPGTKYRPVSG